MSRSGPRAALALAAALGAMAATQTPALAFTDAEKAEIGTVVRDYLMKNPEVLQDVINELEKKQAAQEAAGRTQALAGLKSVIYDSPRGNVIGNPKGDVTLVEFFDYNCGYCKHALEDLNKLTKSDPNLKVILKEFPVLGKPSVEAAQVAVAVRMVAPDKYWAFHNALLGSRGTADRAKALQVAKDVGIDPAAIQKVASSPELNASLDESMKIAQALSLNGTPSYILGDEVVVGAVGYDQLKASIDAQRKAKTKAN